MQGSCGEVTHLLSEFTISCLQLFTLYVFVSAIIICVFCRGYYDAQVYAFGSVRADWQEVMSVVETACGRLT